MQVFLSKEPALAFATVNKSISVIFSASGTATIKKLLFLAVAGSESFCSNPLSMSFFAPAYEKQLFSKIGFI